MKKPDWFERTFQFGVSAGMLPFFIERLEGTIARLEKKIKGQPDQVLSYQPQGKWSIKQHIGHLAEVDEVALRRIDEMINGVSPMSPAVFEPQRYYLHQPAEQVPAPLIWVIRKKARISFTIHLRPPGGGGPCLPGLPCWPMAKRDTVKLWKGTVTSPFSLVNSFKKTNTLRC